MAAPEKNLWTTAKKHLPNNVAAWRIENRAGTGMPDVAMCFDSLSTWVELKAPRSEPRIVSENLIMRPHLFGFSYNDWSDSMLKGLTSRDLIDQAPVDHFPLKSSDAKNASATQKAWHAKAFALGGVTYFLQKAPGPSCIHLFSPYVCPGSGALRLGVVCSGPDWGVVFYALRLSAEVHALRALGVG